MGSIVVATGFDTYEPEVGEFGYGIDGVVTLPEFKKMVDASAGPLACATAGRSRPSPTSTASAAAGRKPGAQPTARATAARPPCTRRSRLAASDAELRQYHLYRDMRTYGKYELLYAESRERGSVYLRVPDDDAAGRRALARPGGSRSRIRDLLTGGEEVAIPADLVVLVTGMVPRENEELVGVLKLPVGNDGFFNEIHPKLRPVETIVDGVLICGACQCPKNSARERRLRPGRRHAERRHAQARLRRARPAGGDGRRGRLHLVRRLCVEACPYARHRAGRPGGRQTVAHDQRDRLQGLWRLRAGLPGGARSTCCGYTDAQIKAMIDGLLEIPVA